MRAEPVVKRDLRCDASVKDVIESCGVPHTEVDLIVVSALGDEAQRAVDFGWIVRAGVEIAVHAAPVPDEVLPGAARLQERGRTRFVADGHLGKLARNLRLLGFDTAWERDADDRRLVEIMLVEDRALLTRDRRLLMRAVVMHGYCPRADDAETQAREVLRRFDLVRGTVMSDAFRRCLECNGLLAAVPKESVLEPLAAEPLTLRWYDAFLRCAGCGRIYWRGTHFEKLSARVSRLRRA